MMKSKLFWAAGAVALLACACTADVIDEEGAGGDGNGGVGASGTGVGGTGAGGTGTGTGTGSGTGGSQLIPIAPEEGQAQDITLSVYSDGWGNLLESFTVAGEGTVTIDVEEENPYTEPPQYYIYAEADGFYTELYSCTKGGTIDVDLDAVPERPNAITGVIFATQGYFADSPFANASIQLVGPDVSGTITTDAQGRYGIEGLPAGTYRLNFSYQNEPIVLEADNTTESTDYEDLYFSEPMQAS